MNIKDIINYDWFKAFFGRVRNSVKSKSIESNMLSEIDAIKEEKGRKFGQLSHIQSNKPKELVSDYPIPESRIRVREVRPLVYGYSVTIGYDGRPRVREVRPLVYGYSVTVGPDGKPKVREFGNVSSLNAGGEKIGFADYGPGEDSQKIAEREPLVDVNTTDKEVKVVMEILGVKKEDIRINAYDEAVEVTANSAQRKYHKTIDLPQEADIETARSRYNNGILEITFNKKKKYSKEKSKSKIQ
jgi:HSP20 family protein